MDKEKDVFDKLHKIYQKHRKRFKSNPDSKQMCCMWSTVNPPDQIIDTRQLIDIESAFDISIEEDDAYLLYDMNLNEAASKISELIEAKC